MMINPANRAQDAAWKTSLLIRGVAGAGLGIAATMVSNANVATGLGWTGGTLLLTVFLDKFIECLHKPWPVRRDRYTLLNAAAAPPPVLINAQAI